jgi:hypothetical protein
VQCREREREREREKTRKVKHGMGQAIYSEFPKRKLNKTSTRKKVTTGHSWLYYV